MIIYSTNTQFFSKKAIFVKERLETDSLLKKFISSEENENILLNFLDNPTLENKLIFDKAFKKFYFSIRFISYISKTIHFLAMNFDKVENLKSHKESLILDNPIESNSFLPTANVCMNDEKESFLEVLADKNLYKAFIKLTERQQSILELVYLHGYKDTEIAKYFNCSQQAISKNRKKALDLLKVSL